ncbi:anthocyanidin 3-O-glucosyltransferase 2-like [Phragmites australis]|uniref:anthocyanidin 3-O-glucosyltransferase 2-like n=1 Tax=Phragmites australis TaxID=29695 RepID=UPI002D79DB2C|nr:anthocyanidin 3-O-glucosyltransferase 2-like [Phragmites australis]
MAAPAIIPTTPTHVVLLPDPSSGHLMPLIQAGIRILRHAEANATVTVLLVRPTTPDSAAKVAAQVQRIAASGSGAAIRFHHLPAIEPPAPFPPGQVPAFKSRYMQLYAPHVKAAIAALRPAPSALLLDFFATAALDDFDVPAYVYFTSTATMLALMLRLPALQEELPFDFADMDGTVDIPGMSPVPAACMPEILARKNSLNYSWFVSHGRRFMEADGIVANTVSELEPGILGAIAAGRCVPGHAAPPVYPIGPVIDLDGRLTSEHRCVAWLDAQPAGSVVYLCFGSVGWFEAAQARELAAGLERSGHRFLWVLRGPPAAGSGSHHPTDGDAATLLPEGFLERTEARGLVWPAWAPQQEILAHAAMGAFVTHGGWNSCLESLWSGVPMVPWPLYAEQHLNAFQMVAEMGVAVPLEGAGGKERMLVEAAAVERAVRSVMGETQDGRRARENAMRMKLLCRKAVDAGGSSHAALQRLCDDIRRRTGTTAAV